MLHLLRASGNHSARIVGVFAAAGVSAAAVKMAAEAHAAAAAVAVKRVDIDSANKAGKLPVYIAETKDGKGPGLIVIQEWWGVNDQMKRRAGAFAAEGFRAAVPDLFRGQTAKYTERERANHLLAVLDWPGAVQDLAATAKHLKAEGCDKIGVVGYCMGGALSVAAGVHVPEVSAVSCYYGVPNPDLADVSKTHCPVQGHFGDRDDMAGFSDKPAADKLEAQLRAAGVEVEFFRYPHSGHAFANDQRLEAYNAADAASAFQRTVAFFKRVLGN